MGKSIVSQKIYRNHTTGLYGFGASEDKEEELKRLFNMQKCMCRKYGYMYFLRGLPYHQL